MHLVFQLYISLVFIPVGSQLRCLTMGDRGVTMGGRGVTMGGRGVTMGGRACLLLLDRISAHKKILFIFFFFFFFHIIHDGNLITLTEVHKITMYIKISIFFLSWFEKYHKKSFEVLSTKTRMARRM